jgi:hypothetical protein
MGSEESILAGAPPASFAIEWPLLSWREPTASSPALRPSTSGPDESLPETIARVRSSQQAKKHIRWQNRKAGLGAFFGGLGFLAVGVFIIWFNAWWSGELVVPVRLLLILLVPLAISLAGLYSLLTGEKTIDFNGELAWDITIGPEGISRLPVGPGLIDGRIYYWHAITRLEFEEDRTYGTGRVLVIHMADGNRERIRIAAEVTEEQLADTVAAWGKWLEVAAAGVWNSKGI